MPVDLEFNYNETTSAMDVFSEGDIEELRHWTQTLDKSKLVPKDLSDKQLVLFYNACYGDMDKTKVCIENYYNYRRNSPEIFNYRVLKSEELREAAEVIELFPLPGKSNEGYEVIYIRMRDTDPSKYNLESLLKLFVMTVDLSLSKRGPQPGHMCFYDMQGLQFGHITRTNPFILRKMFQYLQEAVPLRVQGFHILNTEPILEKLLTFIKPFVDKKFFDMIKCYNKNEVNEKIHGMVPKSSLPQEYGGTLPDTQTLHKEFMQQLQSLGPYFMAEEEQRMVALPDTTGDNTLEGTFKKLDID